MLRKAVAPSTRGGGKWSNFSISGKANIDLRNWLGKNKPELDLKFLMASQAGGARFAGRNTTSTYGARLMMLSPS